MLNKINIYGIGLSKRKG